LTLIIPQLTYAPPPVLEDEIARLEDLYAMKVVGTDAEERFDRFTRLAATMLEVPMAAISLVDSDRQWIKSGHGVPLREMPRDISFCGHAIAEPSMLVIPDAREDRRFIANPMVIDEPGIRFYAGAVIRGPHGKPVGTVCVLDLVPRQLAPKELSALDQIARMVEREMQLTQHVDEIQQQVRSLALVDHATGLPNLASCMAELRRCIAQAGGKTPRVLLALLRVHRFDALDAALGGDAAGYLIGRLAERVREKLGENCHVASVREDNLGVVMPIADRRQALNLLDAAVRIGDHPFQLGDHLVRLTLSIGASVFPDDGQDAQVLFKRARTALWSRPFSAQSGYRFYQRRQSSDATRQFEIEAAMRAGLEKGEFTTVFQPRIDAARNLPVGAEALVRWQSATLGAMPPDRFIPVAEETGLIAGIGACVLEAACRHLQAWSRKGMVGDGISVNVTSQQLREPGFAAAVRERIGSFSLDPKLIMLELTESTLVDDVKGTASIMHELRDAGIRIAIDDFGTGFSSLSYLQRLPIDTLKIDRSFISRIPVNEGDMKLVRSIISIGKELELEVVAEGVETKEQLEFLRSIGCDQIQGFYFSKPLAPADFESFVADWPKQSGSARSNTSR
jgi:EAL domain-containing protein (putative c-di-GMP-specific phosphodiesterase class I)/GGDEF domain-containing protein